MASEPRFASRLGRRAIEPTRPVEVYDDDSGTSWSAKLDAYVPVTADQVEAIDVAPAEKVGAKSNTPSLNDSLQDLIDFDGAMCVALVDSESGMILGRAGSGVDLDLAAAGASVMLRARRATIKTLGLPDEIDDLLVTLTTQLQIIRPLTQSPAVFLYLVVDRAKSSLAMARFKATEADRKIVL